jgi:myo-inositol-1(or 4)-monophosphatase
LLGLLREGLPLAGGVVLPASKELYYAEKGSGAYCNGAPIFVSKEQKLINVLVAYGIDGHQENPEFTQKECEILAEIVLNIRNLRSSNSCFDFMQVAKGKYGAYLNQTSKIWDNVAPQIIIEEAGGVYTDFFGNPPDYSSPLEKTETNFTFCTGAPQLHQALQKIIKHKHK